MSLQPQFHPFRGWFLKTSFLAVSYIVLESYIPDFTFIASVVLALHLYVPSTSISLLHGIIYEKSILSGYIHCIRNLYSKFHISSFSSFGSTLIYPFNLHFTPSRDDLKHFLVVIHIVRGINIPNLTFLSLVVLALHWYVPSTPLSPL